MNDKIVLKGEEVVLDLVDCEKRKIQALAVAENLEIINPKDETFAIDALADIKGYIKEVEGIRKAVVEKPRKFVDSINSHFKPIIEGLEIASAKVNKKLQFYRDACRIRQEEEETHQAEEYQKRLEEEKLQAARDNRPEQIVAPPPVFVEPDKTVRTATSKATFVEFWDFDLADVHALYKARPDLVKLEPKRREILEALKTTQDIPGIVPFRSSSTRIR